MQITFLVDDLDVDPDAVDLFSYTFLCQVSGISSIVATYDFIRVEVQPTEFLGDDHRWVASSIEII